MADSYFHETEQQQFRHHNAGYDDAAQRTPQAGTASTANFNWFFPSGL